MLGKLDLVEGLLGFAVVGQDGGADGAVEGLGGLEVPLLAFGQLREAEGQVGQFLLPLVFRTPLKYYSYFKEESPYGVKNERLRKMIENYYAKAKLDDYSQVHLCGYPVIPVSCMYQNHLLAKYVMSRLPEIKTPALLLQARHDDTTSPRNSHYIYDHIASPHKDIAFLEDSYHIITADQEREKVVNKVIDFFGAFS